MILIFAVTAGAFAWLTQKNQPEVSQPAQVNIPKKIDQAADIVPSEVKGWQTYRNDKYGFELKYPGNLLIEEEDNSFTKEKFIRFENKQLINGPRDDYLAYFIEAYKKTDDSYKEYLKIKSEEETNPVKDVTNFDIGGGKKIEFYIISSRVSYDSCSTQNSPGCKYWDIKLPQAFGFLETDNYAFYFYISSPNNNLEREIEYLKKSLSTFKFIAPE